MILILSGVLLCLLAVIFLIVGTKLARERDSEETETTETVGSSEEIDRITLPEVMKGRRTLLETADSTTLAGRLRALKQAGATAASVPMNRADGTLLYRSATGTALGMSAEEVSVTIANASRLAKDQSLRLSGVYYLTFLEEEDELLRSVARAETAALLAEALSDGMDDILLLCPDADKTAVGELSLLAEEVRRLSGKGALGLCLSQAILDGSGSAVAVDDLSLSFDFLAIDATRYEDSDPVAYVESVAAEHLDHLLRYRMRLLLPSNEDTAREDAVIAAAEQYSAKRWQILP